MAHIKRSALLPFSNTQMFNLVNEVEAYPHYMDGCVAIDVLARETQFIDIRFHLAKRGIQQTFVTRNHLAFPSSIRMELIDGPFSSFDGRWTFQNLGGEGCKVMFDLQFAMTNKLVSLAAKKLFETVSNNLVDAVCQRAKQRYGK